jgi:hypothetical protein
MLPDDDGLRRVRAKRSGVRRRCVGFGCIERETIQAFNCEIFRQPRAPPRLRFWNY